MRLWGKQISHSREAEVDSSLPSLLRQETIPGEETPIHRVREEFLRAVELPARNS